MRKRVLIIDDEPIICRGLEKELTDAGYEVVSAGSCADALEQVKSGCYDLIFLDLVLPGKDGAQTYQEIKAICPKAKIIFMTGMLETDPIFKQMHLSNAGERIYYLHKPFMEDEILEVAQKALKDK